MRWALSSTGRFCSSGFILAGQHPVLQLPWQSRTFLPCPICPLQVPMGDGDTTRSVSDGYNQLLLQKALEDDLILLASSTQPECSLKPAVK